MFINVSSLIQKWQHFNSFRLGVSLLASAMCWYHDSSNRTPWKDATYSTSYLVKRIHEVDQFVSHYPRVFFYLKPHCSAVFSLGITVYEIVTGKELPSDDGQQE